MCFIYLKSKIMIYIGWVLFGWGFLMFFLFTLVWMSFGLFNKKTKEYKKDRTFSENFEIYGSLLISILTIGVGSYIINNFQ